MIGGVGAEEIGPHPVQFLVAIAGEGLDEFVVETPLVPMAEYLQITAALMRIGVKPATGVPVIHVPICRSPVDQPWLSEAETYSFTSPAYGC